MKAREQLLSLVRIQQLANEIRQAKGIVDAAPAQVEEIERRFRDRNAEFVALKERNDELARDQRTRSAELAMLEEKKKKFMDDLMQVKNQKEYSAMLREIDAVKAQIAGHEEAVLRDMEEIDKLERELVEYEEHIAKERDAVAIERREVEARAEEARIVIERRSAEREEVEGRLPSPLRAGLHRLEPRRQGIFVAEIENGVCQSCFVRVRPQVAQEIRTALVVHTCDSCKRFLYDRSLTSPPEEGVPAQRDVETANGGAV
ncbi:MAG TPA: C4-type zinc ribbon domain-containing protein [Candidatus Polarisedimenticolaceae bacterium]|nr:C4-type zinc ribbon domain-containing protein [Candidatus Polarisedimenticolaceae bacterium]